MAEYTYQVAYNFTDIDTYVKRIDLTPFVDFIIPVPFDDNNQYYVPFTGDDTQQFCTNEEVTEVKFYEQCSEDEIVMPDAVVIDGNCFTIDFSEVASSILCFRVKVNGNGLEYGFNRADDDCSETLTIESFYNTTDVFGNNYENGYSNKTRLFAQLEHVEDETTENKQNNKLINVGVQEVYELRLTKPLPTESFMLKKLLKVILRGNDITVIRDGKTYVFEPVTDSLRKDNSVNTDWLTVARLKAKTVTYDYLC